MDIWEIDKLKLFLLFFIPGFITMKIYQLFVATDRVDFTKAIFETIGYSCINFAFFFWVLVLIHRESFITNHPLLYFIIMGVLLFITPIFWTILFIWLTKTSKLKIFFLNPVKSAWDYVFDQRKSYWTIVHLKNGEKIGGVYSSNSFASAYPRKEQIYLEEQWKIGDNDKFINKINRTGGILILGDEIKSIKFLTN